MNAPPTPPTFKPRTTDANHCRLFQEKEKKEKKLKRPAAHNTKVPAVVKCYGSHCSGELSRPSSFESHGGEEKRETSDLHKIWGKAKEIFFSSFLFV